MSAEVGGKRVVERAVDEDAVDEDAVEEGSGVEVLRGKKG